MVLIVPPVTLSPTPFSDRDRLAGNHGFVNRGFAVEHNAIHRHFIARSHAQFRAGLNRFKRHVTFLTVLNNPRGLGRKVQQSANGAPGLAARPQFEHLAKQHQHDDDRGGLKINSHLAA